MGLSHNKLSVIIPFVNEYPQILFTLQSILSETSTLPIETEIITIDNFCPEIEHQILHGEDTKVCPYCFEKIDTYRIMDKSGERIREYANSIKNLKYIKFDRKLSHWNAKNQGVLASTGNILLFLDAHVCLTPGSLLKMYDYVSYEDNRTLAYYFPLTYLLDFKRQLKYRIDTDPSRSYYGYQFAGYSGNNIEEVPCMSTCGMMIHRNLFDFIGGWPSELGIYGGGENFMNYVMAILGIRKQVYPVGPIFHYAEKRGYYFNYDDFVRNRAIATYMVSGDECEKACWNYLDHCEGNKEILKEICKSIVTNQSIKDQHKVIQGRQIHKIDEWLECMKQANLWDGAISTKKYVS